MDATKLGKALKKGELPGAVLLAGEEEALAERALGQILDKVRAGPGAADLAISRLEGKAATAAEVEAATRSGSLFGGRRLVIVREAQQIPAAEQKKLAEYLKKPLAGTTLVLLVRGGGAGRDPQSAKAAGATRLFTKAVEEGGGLVVECPRPKARDLPRLAEELLAEQGMRADRDGLYALTAAVGEDLGALAQAVEKLAVYRRGQGVVQAADVAEVVADTRSQSIFDLTDATAEGDAARALSVLRRALRDGESPLAILGHLARHLRNLARVQALAERGERQEQIREALGLHPFVVKKAMDQARLLTPAALARGLVLAAEVDRGLKGGALDEEVQLERLVMALSGAGGRGRARR